MFICLFSSKAWCMSKHLFLSKLRMNLSKGNNLECDSFTLCENIDYNIFYEDCCMLYCRVCCNVVLSRKSESNRLSQHREIKRFWQTQWYSYITPLSLIKIVSFRRNDSVPYSSRFVLATGGKCRLLSLSEASQVLKCPGEGHCWFYEFIKLLA